MADLETINYFLDKLTVDSLTLMEEYIDLKLSLEDSMNDGETNLAKSRYILGQNNVSKLQLPSEDSNDFSAGVVVNSEINPDLGFRHFDVEFVKESDEKSEVKNPLRWFGVLVPQSMHLAQKKYKEALNWVGMIANIQSKLEYNCLKMDQLKYMKYELTKTEKQLQE
ncbi:coiled-coil domain-containing protein 115 [Onthophagus taurus]|uniref:coiled-coil domain-containing protein 115 n=1 Tax=Onthophagus taurus TaxID=166361 RepID=UPI000C20C299|nr:coiled-coil domain-containing protein 115-like [Onthophagus taurus]